MLTLNISLKSICVHPARLSPINLSFKTQVTFSLTPETVLRDNPECRQWLHSDVSDLGPFSFATINIGFYEKGSLGPENGCCWSGRPCIGLVHHPHQFLAINGSQLPPSQKKWPPPKQATMLRDIWRLTLTPPECPQPMTAWWEGIKAKQPASK